MHLIALARALMVALHAKFNIAHCANAGEIDPSKIAAPSDGDGVVAAPLSVSKIGLIIVSTFATIVGVMYVH